MALGSADRPMRLASCGCLPPAVPEACGPAARHPRPAGLAPPLTRVPRPCQPSGPSWFHWSSRGPLRGLCPCPKEAVQAAAGQVSCTLGVLEHWGVVASGVAFLQLGTCSAPLHQQRAPMDSFVLELLLVLLRCRPAVARGLLGHLVDLLHFYRRVGLAVEPGLLLPVSLTPAL